MQDFQASTAFSIPGYRVTACHGVVRGLVVRSPNFLAGIVASLRQLVGGNITEYTQNCEQARAEAYQIMVGNAQRLAANAVLGMRYDSSEILEGITEVLAYGTAVVLERE